MKKLKLLFAAIALLCSTVAMAQKDVTDLYITNAKLSDGTNGWTKTFTKNKVTNDPADAFSVSTRGNNTVGFATEAYAGYGELIQTAYSMKQTITLPKGNYTLVSYSFFRQGDTDDEAHNKVSKAYLKAGSESKAIYTLRSITASGYANSQSEGADVFDSKMYRNTIDFTIDADNTSIEIGIEGTFDEKRSWCIVGQFELIDNDQLATMDSPFDVTGYMTNPGFEYRDMTGWTLSEDDAIGVHNGDQNWKVGRWFAEKWQQTGAWSARSISQTLTNLPAGLYRLSANLGGDGTYLDLNGKTVYRTEDKDYTVGYVLAAGEDLVITAGKNDEGEANWIHFDNFRLQFCGDVQAALTTLLAQVTEYNGKIPTAAYTNLQSNVSTYNKSYTDVDELLAAIDAVQALYDTADQLKEPYATCKELIAEGLSLATGYNNILSLANTVNAAVEAATDATTIINYNNQLSSAITVLKSWLNMKNAATTLQAVANDNTTANAALEEAINTQETNVKAATGINLATEIPNATTALETAMTTYVGVANPVGDGAKFDCTFLMTNPDVSDFATWARVEDVDGWYSDYTDGNCNVMHNNDVACDKGNAFFEYWSENAKSDGKFALYNLVENLSKGTYTINCYAIATANGVQGATNSAVYFYANDTEGSLISADVLTEATISFVNNSQQDVKIGLKPMTGNQFRWMGIGYVELYKVPAQTFIVSENAEYDTTQEGAGAVTLTRTILANTWNTIWLPFSMTESDLKATFGDDVKIAEFSETPNANIAGQSTISFNIMETPAISANKPVLLKTSTASNGNYTIEGRTVVAGTPTTNGTNFSFFGTTVASTTIESGDYFIASDKLWKSVGQTTIKGTRAYLKAQASGARIIGFSIDGNETTAIENIEQGTITTGKVYNLNGQEVKSAQKGILIQNGRKVVVK